MKNNLKGELAVMDSLDIKPNYAALGRKYGMNNCQVLNFQGA
ncbi:MAG: hypothetical protein ACLRMH_01030 [Lachnospiraceae bacterium]